LKFFKFLFILVSTGFRFGERFGRNRHDYDAFKKIVFPKEGESYFIAKPIENEEILTRINTVLTNTN